jgi:drug/metabolite transporter (DMT)-like permease
VGRVNGGRGASARMVVLALLWGSGFLWIKLALTGLSPVHLTLVRCALGALTLLALAFAARQRLGRSRCSASANARWTRGSRAS